MPVSRADVIWAYRTFLGREPENDRVVREHCGARDLHVLCERFLSCQEFGVGHGRHGPLPIYLPRLKVETEAAPLDIERLWARVRNAWVSLGNNRPYHSVLTDDRFAPANVEQFQSEFWASGEAEAAEVSSFLTDQLEVRLAEAEIVEFGCGVGRVTVPLAKRAKHLFAYDISEPHIEIARARAEAQNCHALSTHVIGASPPGEFEPCDIFYSRIVLQHNPPPIIGHVLRRLIRALRPGGVGVFQLPTYCVGYRFAVREALMAPQKLDMDMHCFPQADLLALLAAERARPLLVREDDAPGRADLFVSNTFVIRKLP